MRLPIFCLTPSKCFAVPPTIRLIFFRQHLFATGSATGFILLLERAIAPEFPPEGNFRAAGHPWTTWMPYSGAKRVKYLLYAALRSAAKLFPHGFQHFC